MTTFDPSSTLVSTTYEGAILELLTLASTLQRDTAVNTNNVSLITNGTYSNNTGLYSFTLSIPCTKAIDAVSGVAEITATEVWV